MIVAGSARHYAAAEAPGASRSGAPVVRAAKASAGIAGATTRCDGGAVESLAADIPPDHRLRAHRIPRSGPSPACSTAASPSSAPCRQQPARVRRFLTSSTCSAFSSLRCSCSFSCASASARRHLDRVFVRVSPPAAHLWRAACAVVRNMRRIDTFAATERGALERRTLLILLENADLVSSRELAPGRLRGNLRIRGRGIAWHAWSR